MANPIGHLKLKTEKEFGVPFSLEGVRRLRVRHGFSCITSRPPHSKAAFEAQQQFCDAVTGSGLNILSKGLAMEQVWVFFRTSRGLDNVGC